MARQRAGEADAGAMREAGSGAAVSLPPRVRGALAGAAIPAKDKPQEEEEVEASTGTHFMEQFCFCFQSNQFIFITSFLKRDLVCPLTWLPREDINLTVSFGRRGRNLTMRQRQTGHPEPIGRSSLRSKASKGSSGATASGAVGGGTGGGEGQRMRKFKDCCRVTLEFTFTQVGVGALVVAYTIMGAFIFQYLETQETDLSVDLVNRYRHGTVRSLWNLTHYFNVLNKDRWTQEVDEQLYQVLCKHFKIHWGGEGCSPL